MATARCRCLHATAAGCIWPACLAKTAAKSPDLLYRESVQSFGADFVARWMFGGLFAWGVERLEPIEGMGL